MAYNFIECNRNQQYLMPPSVKEWLPEEMRSRSSRLKRLKECKERLER